MKPSSTSHSRLRVAVLTSDGRESWREYHKPEPYFFTPQEALFQGIATFSHVEMHVISCWQEPMSAPPKLAENIWFHGLLVPKIGWMRTGYQGCIRAVRRKLREIQPQIVHGQGTERDCAISAVLSGFPNVMTIHGNLRAIAKVTRARPFSFDWLSARLESWTLPRTDGVVCITEYTRRQVNGLVRRTWVLPNAVDSAIFDISNVPTSPPQILHIAHIQKRKNQIMLIHALEPLAKEFGFKVSFHGVAREGDPYASECLEMIRQRPWCEYHAFSDRPAIKAALASATLLVLPSLEENCPMSVLEAMAAGVPVVASNTGGTPELFQQGVTGLFCDPTDAVSIRNAVQALLGRPEVARAMAGRAREAARQRFHPKVIARGHIQIYGDVLNASAPQS
jgi:glycosyltransferase involved in cell wall biosynthesis